MTTFTTEDRVNATATPIEDVTLDASDACIEFCEDSNIELTENEVWIFNEGYNRGVEAMRQATLTLLEKNKGK